MRDATLSFPSDDVLARDPDRQVLVVGETVVGFTLTHLLRRGGYDPVLVSANERRLTSEVTYLWPPVVRVFQHLGVGQEILDRSLAVDAVSVRRFDSTAKSETVLTRTADSVTTPPVLVRTSDIRRVLFERLRNSGHRVDRSVDALSRHEDGLQVAFANGVQEWFDVIVDASEGDVSLRPDDEPFSGSTDLWQYETTVDATPPTGTRLCEAWYPNALVQRLPRPNEPGSVLRVTTHAPDLPASLTDGPHSSDSALASELDGVEPLRVRQTTLSSSDAGRSRWATEGVAFCGRAACPFVPATGSTVSLGVEEALAFVQRVTEESRPAADALGDYATVRANRVATLRHAAEAARPDHEYPAPESANEPLGSISALRTVALGSFLGGQLASVQRDGFE